MNSVLYPVCAGVAWLALLYKTRVLRTDRSAAQLALTGNFLLLGITYTVSTPVVWVATSRAAGIVNFSGLLTQSCVVLMSACQQLVLLHLTHERATAWRKAVPRLIALALVLVTMVTLFSAATIQREAPNDFALSKAQYYPAYITVYLVAYTANQIDVGILGWRYAKVAATPWLRRGLLLIALTLPFALVYSGCRAADVIAGQFGTDGRAWEPVAQLAVTIATITKIIGWTIPDWGRHLSTLADGVRDRLTYRELVPFHREVTALVPEPVIPLDPRADLRTRLYRTVVEIRDAQWSLRTWMDPAVADAARRRAEAARLRDDDVAAVVEAAQLRAAIQAKAAQRQPAVHTHAPRVAEPGDLAAELAFQRRLARAFAGSPLVTAALADTTSPRTEETA
ncbi:MAB_1171c family putative transporter [Streptomyces sp. NPDC021096]|uniref:MAB_1171c family putative transporter n=1 Tax=Streptomyces sp. NPDC021096 TaxID=3154792 RepID=UPI003407C383